MIAVVLTTINKEGAELLRDRILEAKLAGCIWFIPISSKYWWKGKLEEDEEELLVIKTTLEKREELIEFIRKNHPYEVPEIIDFGVNSDKPYFDWLNSVVKGKD